MKKTLNLSNSEIIARIAGRKRLMAENAADLRRERQAKFNAYIDDYMAANNFPPEIRNDVIALIGDSFVYRPGAELAAMVNTKEQEAYALLPKQIRAERWEPDTCGCKLWAVYDSGRDYDESVQTYLCLPCPAHAGMSDEEVHDAVHEESKRKNAVLNTLLGYDGVSFGLEEAKTNADGTDAGLGLKAGLEYSWSFTGAGKDRVLRAEVKGTTLAKEKKDAIRALFNKKFGAGKAEII